MALSAEKEIWNPNKPEKDVRDHFIHSLQYFLLSLALYPRFSKYTGQLYNVSDITGILFTMTMYHDIGYLYNLRGAVIDEINNELKRILFDNMEIFKIFSINFDDIDGQEEYGIKPFFIKIRGSDELKEIWKDENTNHDEYYLRSIAEIDQFSCDAKSHHSYMSAIFLVRILHTKYVIENYFGKSNTSTKIAALTPASRRKKEFENIIRAILFHDFEMQNPISIEDDFLASFLILIDELQTYTRSPQDSRTGAAVLNPKYIGFKWIDKKRKLRLDYNRKFVNSISEMKLKDAYKKHNNKEIVRVLNSKLDTKSLEFLNIDE